MISDFQRGVPMTLGDLGSVKREWVKKDQSVFQTQLQFNDTVAPSVYNRATRVRPPSPILIQKLVQRTQGQDDVESCTSSLRLSILSEDRLQAAVRLARRDLHRKRQESISRFSLEPPDASPPRNDMNHSFQVCSVGTMSGRKNQKKNDDGVIMYTPQKRKSNPRPGHTPPTKDLSNEQQLSQEIHKLQKELSTYVQRIEQLASKGHAVEVQEPDEKRRMEIRRQEQTARSARIIYVLQQQVKEIQEDLDKLRSENMKHIKKSRAMDRLAAAHRAAVRAMQVFTSQLSDPAESKVPTHCKELGQLIRQLSLCSAKVEVRQGSAVPETALDILQKLEILDSALSKQKAPRQRDPELQNAKPEEKGSLKAGVRNVPPPFPIKGPPKRASQGLRKPAARKKSGERLAGKHHKNSQALVKERNAVLKAGLESIIHHQQQRREEEPIKQNKSVSIVNPSHVKAGHVHDSSFQQPTVSSRLRENQVPHRETTVPWIPTSPHSPSRHCVVSSRPEPRCLFSTVKSPEKQEEQMRSTDNTTLNSSSHNMKQVQNEALRQAWLERVTAESLKELNHLSKEEADRISKVRTKVDSATQCEFAARDRIQPLLDQAQPAASVDMLSKAVFENLQEDSAQTSWAAEMHQAAEIDAEKLLQRTTLESMLLRMEEIERDEAEVRRRFGTISYSDPLTWDKSTNARNISRPASPQPIRLTKPAISAPGTADILLQRPVETGAVSDTSMMDDESSTLNNEGRRTGGVRLFVPPSMQRSIQQYRTSHDAFLQLVSHNAVGSFNPWVIADSLADELMDEALAEVAAEFQDVCEEYAEAVFTSEFLQPVQSHSTSVS